MKNILGMLLGSANDRLVKSYDKTVSLINDLEPKCHAMSDEELRGQTDVLRARLAAGDKEKDILPDAFALVREASVRTIGLRHFNVQMIGGMVLTNGQIAEMKTGEGKTLVATLAMYLKALHGKGAHLIAAHHTFHRVVGETFNVNMPLQKEHRDPAHNVKAAFALCCHYIFLYHNWVKSLSMNILSIVAPAGIIGKMFSPSPTHASRRNAPSAESICSIAPSSSSRPVTLAEGMP